MCQPAPGPRCWKDTSARHAKLEARLSKAETEFSASNEALSDATEKMDYTKYEKARTRNNTLNEKVRNLRAEVSLNRRDMDGTRTGQKKLEEAIAETTSPIERKVLQQRMRTGAALAESRKRALELKRSNHVPLFRIENEKVAA